MALSLATCPSATRKSRRCFIRCIGPPWSCNSRELLVNKLEFWHTCAIQTLELKNTHSSHIVEALIGLCCAGMKPISILFSVVLSCEAKWASCIPGAGKHTCLSLDFFFLWLFCTIAGCIRKSPACSLSSNVIFWRDGPTSVLCFSLCFP